MSKDEKKSAKNISSFVKKKDVERLYIDKIQELKDETEKNKKIINEFKKENKTKKRGRIQQRTIDKFLREANKEANNRTIQYFENKDNEALYNSAKAKYKNRYDKAYKEEEREKIFLDKINKHLNKGKKKNEKVKNENKLNPIRDQWQHQFDLNRGYIEKRYNDYNGAQYEIPYNEVLETQIELGSKRYNENFHEYVTVPGYDEKKNGKLAKYPEITRDIILRMFPNSLYVIRENDELKTEDEKKNPIRPYVKISIGMWYKTYEAETYEITNKDKETGYYQHLISYTVPFIENSEQKEGTMIPNLRDEDVIEIAHKIMLAINKFLQNKERDSESDEGHYINEVYFLKYAFLNMTQEQKEIEEKRKNERETRAKEREENERKLLTVKQDSKDIYEEMSDQMSEEEKKKRMHINEDTPDVIYDNIVERKKKRKKGGNSKHKRNDILIEYENGYKTINVPSYGDHSNCLISCFKYSSEHKENKRKQCNTVRNELHIEKGPIAYDNIEIIEKLCSFYQLNCEIYYDENKEFLPSETNIVINKEYHNLQICLSFKEFQTIKNEKGETEEIGHYKIMDFPSENKRCRECHKDYVVRNHKDEHKCNKKRKEFISKRVVQFYDKIGDEKVIEKEFLKKDDMLYKMFKEREPMINDLIIMDIETYASCENETKGKKPLKVYCVGWTNIGKYNDEEKKYMLEGKKDNKDMRDKLLEKCRIEYSYGRDSMKFFVDLIKKADRSKIFVAYNGVFFDFIFMYRTILEDNDIRIVSQMCGEGRVRGFTFQKKFNKEDNDKIMEMSEIGRASCR